MDQNMMNNALGWSIYCGGENHNTTVIGYDQLRSKFIESVVQDTKKLNGNTIILDVKGDFSKHVKSLDDYKIVNLSFNQIFNDPFRFINRKISLEQQANLLLFLADLPSQGFFAMTTLKIAIQEAWNNNEQQTTITSIIDILKQKTTRVARKLVDILQPIVATNYSLTVKDEIFSSKKPIIVQFSSIKDMLVKREYLKKILANIFCLCWGRDNKKPLTIVLDNDDVLSGWSDVYSDLIESLSWHNTALVIGSSDVANLDHDHFRGVAFKNSKFHCLLKQHPVSLQTYERVNSWISHNKMGKFKLCLANGINEYDDCVIGVVDNENQEHFNWWLLRVKKDKLDLIDHYKYLAQLNTTPESSAMNDISILLGIGLYFWTYYAFGGIGLLWLTVIVILVFSVFGISDRKYELQEKASSKENEQ